MSCTANGSEDRAGPRLTFRFRNRSGSEDLGEPRHVDIGKGLQTVERLRDSFADYSSDTMRCSAR
jgi:hypothetical protein